MAHALGACSGIAVAVVADGRRAATAAAVARSIGIAVAVVSGSAAEGMAPGEQGVSALHVFRAALSDDDVVLSGRDKDALLVDYSAGSAAAAAEESAFTAAATAADEKDVGADGVGEADASIAREGDDRAVSVGRG